MGLFGDIFGAGTDVADLALRKRQFDYEKEQDEYAKSIDLRNFDYAKGIDERNFSYASSIDARNYAKALESEEYARNQNQIMRQREDTAVQRRAADLKKAGINPILAAGSSASSSPGIAVGTPEMGKAQMGKSQMGISKGTARDEMRLGVLADRIATSKSLMQMDANIARTNAERDFIAVQAAEATARTAGTLQNVTESKARTKSEEQRLKAALLEYAIRTRDWGIIQKYPGIRSDAPGALGQVGGAVAAATDLAKRFGAEVGSAVSDISSKLDPNKIPEASKNEVRDFFRVFSRKTDQYKRKPNASSYGRSK